MAWGTSGRPKIDFGIAILALQNKIARIISGDIFISRISTTELVFPKGTNTQMNAIVSPIEGIIFYDITNHKLNIFNGTTWEALH